MLPLVSTAIQNAGEAHDTESNSPLESINVGAPQAPKSTGALVAAVVVVTRVNFVVEAPFAERCG